MKTRSRSNKKALDERVFPIRVRYRVPEEGFGSRMESIHALLDQELGRRFYSQNADMVPGEGDGVSYYFMNLRDAHRHYIFMQTLELELLRVEETGLLPPWRR